MAFTTGKKGKREKNTDTVFLHNVFLLPCIRTKKMEFFVHQVIYLGNSLPKHVTAAKCLYKFQGRPDKHLEERSIAGRERGVAD